MSDMRPPRPHVREEFRKRLHADLMREAVALAEERRLRPRSVADRLGRLLAVPRLRALAVAVTLVAMLAAGTGAAAAGSLPGDPTFGIKRAAEEVELAFAPGDDAKVQVLAVQAQRRLDELTRTAERPEQASTASAEYEAAVKRFAAAVQAVRASEPGAKHDAVEQVVEDARERHVPVLEDLKERLPKDAQRGIERAIGEQEKLAPAGAPGERPRPTTSPAPGEQKRDERSPAPTARPTERPRATETPHATESPRATATQRSDRPTETPHR